MAKRARGAVELEPEQVVEVHGPARQRPPVDQPPLVHFHHSRPPIPDGEAPALGACPDQAQTQEPQRDGKPTGYAEGSQSQPQRPEDQGRARQRLAPAPERVAYLGAEARLRQGAPPAAVGRSGE